MNFVLWYNCSIALFETIIAALNQFISRALLAVMDTVKYSKSVFSSPSIFYIHVCVYIHSRTRLDRTRIPRNQEFFELFRFPLLILSLLSSHFYVFVELVRSYNTFPSDNQSSIRERKFSPLMKFDKPSHSQILNFDQSSCCYSSNKHALPLPVTVYRNHWWRASLAFHP